MAAREVDPEFPGVYMTGAAADQWPVQGVRVKARLFLGHGMIQRASRTIAAPIKIVAAMTHQA
jgi:hypothetical protein